MRRQLMFVVLTAAVLAGMVIQTHAAEARGSISVTLDYGDGKVYDAALALYRIGGAAEGGFRLTDAFGGGLIKTEDVQSPVLAQWLAETAEGEPMNRILDTDGNAFFSNLSEGLYLLVQSEVPEGFETVSPFMIPLPCYGQWDVAALPKVGQILTESPDTGQHPAPIIGAMGIVLSGIGLIFCADKFRRK